MRLCHKFNFRDALNSSSRWFPESLDSAKCTKPLCPPRCPAGETAPVLAASPINTCDYRWTQMSFTTKLNLFSLPATVITSAPCGICDWIPQDSLIFLCRVHFLAQWVCSISSSGCRRWEEIEMQQEHNKKWNNHQTPKLSDKIVGFSIL